MMKRIFVYTFPFLTLFANCFLLENIIAMLSVNFVLFFVFVFLMNRFNMRELNRLHGAYNKAIFLHSRNISKALLVLVDYIIKKTFCELIKKNFSNNEEQLEAVLYNSDKIIESSMSELKILLANWNNSYKGKDNE